LISPLRRFTVSPFPNDYWPVPVPHARSAGQQRVFVCYVRIGMDRDRRNVQFASNCAFVQRLNILQSMLEPVSAQVDLILGHRIKHERIVRIWGMTQGKDVTRVPGTAMHESLSSLPKFSSSSSSSSSFSLNRIFDYEDDDEDDLFAAKVRSDSF